jgi:hypothetical protein
MKNAAKKPRRGRSVTSEVVSARLSKPEIATLRKLYPGSSNQDIVEKLVEEKLARRDFQMWLTSLRNAMDENSLNLEKV